MMAVRAVELKHQLGEITDQFLAVLPEIRQCADNWLKENEELKSVETRLQKCHQQMALIKEIEAYGPNLNNHPLYAISQKYSSYKQAKNAFEDSKKALVKILADYDTQIEAFSNTTEVLNGPQLLNWIQDFSTPEEDKPIFDHIKEFLTNAGQSPMITQCEQAETELKQSMKQTLHIIRSCLELLSQFVAVSQYYPQSHTEYHRIVLMRKFLSTALESKSPEICREMSIQVAALINMDNNKGEASQQMVAYGYRLQALCAEANAHLGKTAERLQLEGGPDAIARAQDAYMEAKANIANWVRTEEGAATSLECVAIGMLCNLNRRYLMLENGAQSAGDCLIDLTSREGEWFLDDMSSLSTQAVELLSLLPLQSASTEDPTLPVAVECVRNANLLLADLQQLNFNYSTIILPEALKKVHSEDASTLMMINELNAVIMSSPVPLNELLAQLEIHLRYLIMDMESPASSSVVIVEELRSQYEALLTTAPEHEGHSGRMLLMGFNGLFAAVELRARELAEHLAIPVPQAWRKIDHISDAMHMSAALQSRSVRAVLEDVFLVRRVQCVAEVLAQCAQLACAARPQPHNGTLPDESALFRPVKRFIAEFVSRCVLGVHSRALACLLCALLRRRRLDLRAEVEQKEIGAMWSVSLESLCEKACGGVGEGRAAWGAGALVAARARLQGAARAARDHAAAQSQARALVHRAAAHGELVGNGQETSAMLSRRSKELLLALERLGAANTRAQTLLNSVHQRVKWGVGANPSLSGALSSLEEAWSSTSGRVSRLSACAHGMAAHARHAALARHQRAPRPLRHATASLQHWEKACALIQKFSLDVSPTEESLMEMLHPEGNIDTQWVDNVSALLREMTSGLVSEGKALALRSQSGRSALRGAVDKLGGARAARDDLLPDVKAPLQTLQAVNDGVNPAADYLKLDRAVAEKLRLIYLLGSPADGAGKKDKEKECASETAVGACAGAAAALLHELPVLKSALLEVHSKWSAEQWSRHKLTRQAAVSAPLRNNKTGAGAGGLSAVGAGVWRRVRLKLEGRDQDATRHSLQEQVDYIIKEATSSENLCMMYEGWMAWV